MKKYALENGIIITGDKHYGKARLGVNNNHIDTAAKPEISIDLKEAFYVYPALINIHDHMRGNYLPRVGPKKNQYYTNWSFWDADLKSSSVYEERANLSIEQMYFLSAYKNLFSGVATVNDHFPHEINEPFIPHLPIRVIREYTLAHECSSFDLRWGKGIEIEHAQAVKNNWPFITHLEEGFDPESQDGIGILERLNCLDDHDVFIHCIGFSDEDIVKTAKAGASISWCPGSNFFMFNVTCKIRKILNAGINVAIGTDSTHTGSPNLLEEMRYARKMYQAMYGEDLPASQIFNMVTINPARAFRIQHKTGMLKEHYLADILVIKAKENDPWENLVNAEMHDIALLTIDGLPVLADAMFKNLIDERRYEKIYRKNHETWVYGNPLTLYQSIRKAVGFEKKLEYMPFEC